MTVVLSRRLVKVEEAAAVEAVAIVVPNVAPMSSFVTEIFMKMPFIVRRVPDGFTFRSQPLPLVQVVPMLHHPVTVTLATASLHEADLTVQ